jgi:hypothetical protein
MMPPSQSTKLDAQSRFLINPPRLPSGSSVDRFDRLAAIVYERLYGSMGANDSLEQAFKIQKR